MIEAPPRRQSGASINTCWKIDMIMQDVLNFLSARGIDYDRYDHEPVHTVADIHRVLPSLPGAGTKNLFLRDDKGRRHFLVVVADDRQVDLKRLSKVMGTTRLSFGSSKRLKKYLSIEPGAVSMLAIIKDKRCDVEFFIDRNLWAASAFQCHPMVNTSTLVISRKGIEAVVAASGHKLSLIDVP